MPAQARQLAAIILFRRSISEGGLVHRSNSEGGFTDIIAYTAIMVSNKDNFPAAIQNVNENKSYYEHRSATELC